METFTLTIWLLMGWRYEATEIELYDRGQCARILLILKADRDVWKGECVGHSIPPVRSAPVCAHGGGPCSWPILPGRQRI